jgi:ABC-type multidrug transport system fused ATPase/permease subunit
MTSPFWSTDPKILLNNEYIFQLWPNQSMSFEEKLNAISRLVILLTVLGFLFTMSHFLLLVGFITLVLIFILYNTRKNAVIEKMSNMKASSQNINLASNQSSTLLNPTTLQPFLKTEFEKTSKRNPLSNVLLTDIQDNPTRLSAPPSFHTEVYEDINNTTKKMVQMLNPGIKNTNKQLYGDLGEKFEFDQSQWSFFSNPNTKVCSDQGSFANWLYGNMPSAKEGNAFALLQDNQRYNLY